MFQPLYWSTRTMLWIFASSTVRRIPIGCRTLWMSSHGRCHSSARKVSSSSTSQWRRYWGQGRGAITPSLDKKCVGKSFIHFLGSYGMPSHHGPRITYSVPPDLYSVRGGLSAAFPRITIPFVCLSQAFALYFCFSGFTDPYEWFYVNLSQEQILPPPHQINFDWHHCIRGSRKISFNMSVDLRSTGQSFGLAASLVITVANIFTGQLSILMLSDLLVVICLNCLCSSISGNDGDCCSNCGCCSRYWHSVSLYLC